MKTCLGSQTLVMTVVLVQVFMMERAETFGWPWRWSPSLSSEDGKVGHRHKRAEAGGAASRQRRAERLGRVTFETVREDSYKIHSSLMEQAQQIALRNEGSEYALEASCWSTAYRKLFSSCKEILRDEEKKSRLAFELTRCFLIMNGWPSPPPCPDSKPIKSCTEKIDKSTLETYLVFFQDSAATCYHLQSEAFREETDKMINDLKNSGHLILEKVKDVDELSREILGDTFEQSELIFEKLKNVEDHSAKLLQHHNVVEGLLNTTRDTLEAVYKGSDEILQMQMDLKSMHNDMNATLMEGFNKLDEAAQSTYEHLQGISQVQEEIGHQQVRLADTLSENILHLKDTALESMEELKLSQAMVMEETRSSLKGLSQNVRTAQLEFELWTTELDSKSQAILSGSEEMLKAQELFVNKQNSIMGTLDRLFSLYDITLYESRAFKLFIFYSLSLVFLHFMTSAKQTNSARPLLYPALCISMGTELYLSRAYGSIFDNQQWLQNKCYWIRAVFAVFSAFTIGFFFLTYR
ncbi:hypothetical protein KP509_23G052900 [Ceratopteris richardii]|nr:hypothetical protein KP509_23G052900 [Ceratopteris richardii]